MQFFTIELKRFLKNPKNQVCLVLLFLFILGMFTVNQTVFRKRFAEADLAFIRLDYQQAQQAVNSLEKEVQLHPNDEGLAQALITAKKEHDFRDKQLTAVENNDFATFANLENQLNTSRLDSIPEKDRDSDEYRQLEAMVRYFNAIKSVNGNFSVSVNDSSDSAFIIGRSMVAWLSSTTIFVLVTVLIADGVSHDIESSQIRFYHLMGGRKPKQLVLKLVVPILAVFVTTLTVFLLCYVINGLFDGYGTWQYPYLMSNGIILPIWKMSLNTVTMFLVALIFIGSLGQFLSLIFKKSLVVIGLIVVFLTGFMTISQEEWFQPFKKFVPFEYLGYGQLINDVKILPSKAITIGIIYLTSMSLIFIVFSVYLYQHYYYRKVGK